MHVCVDAFFLYLSIVLYHNSKQEKECAALVDMLEKFDVETGDVGNFLQVQKKYIAKISKISLPCFFQAILRSL